MALENVMIFEPEALTVKLPVPLISPVPTTSVPVEELVLLRFSVEKLVRVPETVTTELPLPALLKLPVANPLRGAEIVTAPVLVPVFVCVTEPAPVPTMAAVPTVINP